MLQQEHQISKAAPVGPLGLELSNGKNFSQQKQLEISR
jgi:hypothetical protein